MKLILSLLAILLVALLSLNELLHSKNRGKVMGIYFTVIGISMFLAILIVMDKEPVSPTELIMNMLKSIGLGEN